MSGLEYSTLVLNTILWQFIFGLFKHVPRREVKEARGAVQAGRIGDREVGGRSG